MTLDVTMEAHGADLGVVGTDRCHLWSTEGDVEITGWHTVV